LVNTEIDPDIALSEKDVLVEGLVIERIAIEGREDPQFLSPLLNSKIPYDAGIPDDSPAEVLEILCEEKLWPAETWIKDRTG
jgi:hypothetical protein